MWWRALHRRTHSPTSNLKERSIDHLTSQLEHEHISDLTFGTYRLERARAAAEVCAVLDRGIRRIDTAPLYKNEAQVYRAIREFEASHSRGTSVCVTSKLHKNLLFEPAVQAVAASMHQLGRAIDVMLLHRPLPAVMWRALDASVDQGLVREIGVSNYSVNRLRELLEVCDPRSSTSTIDGSPCRRPAVNQVEFHPSVGPVHPLLAFCKAKGIRVQGHTMLARGAFFEFPPLVRLAEKYRRSPAVIMLRWGPSTRRRAAIP